MELTAPCGHILNINFPDFLNSCTADCPGCGMLLILNRDEVDPKKVIVENFHEYMHKQNPQWPIDGANTGWVEIGE